MSHSADEAPIRILAFDPGVGSMGWAVLEYCPAADTILVIKHGLIEGDKVARRLRGSMLPEFSKQYTTLCAISDTVRAIIVNETPYHVVSEGPFAHRFIQAYASLKLVVDRLRQVTHSVLNRNVIELQPAEVKRAFTGKGTADKDGMRASLKSHSDITYTKTTKVSVKAASEHEVDAIAVGYSFIHRDLRKNK